MSVKCRNKLLICAVFLLNGCTSGADEPDDETNYYYNGLITKDFVDNLKTLPDDPVTLYLASNGGGADMGLAAANVILEKNVNLVIDGKFGICTSGCAEFILPAVKSVTFINEPLVGYHQNPQIILHLLSELAPEDIKYCDFVKSEVQASEDLVDKAGLNKDFWKETLKRIEVKSAKAFLYEEQCPGLRKEYKYELWFPTSEQMRSMLQLEFEGELCSDRRECYKDEIDQRWSVMTGMVVGDERYFSKGR